MLFETAILNRIHQLNSDQSQLQYDFTKGVSTTMASLLLSEADLDSKSCNRPLYIAPLYTQKAFDIVRHPVLMVKLRTGTLSTSMSMTADYIHVEGTDGKSKVGM